MGVGVPASDTGDYWRRGGRPVPCAADGVARQRARRDDREVTETVLTPERIFETAEDVLRRSTRLKGPRDLGLSR